MVADAQKNPPQSLYDKVALLIGDFDRDPRVLQPLEIWWRDHQPWLESCGYILRDRYKPGWVASWTRGVPIPYAEDWVGLREANIIDATRAMDNSVVMLKKVSRSRHPYELQLTTMWNEPPVADHPHNHCVRLIEVLSPPDDEDIDILVLPLLRELISPDFQTVGEAVDFFRQAFEGLNFIHENHVAHRDCNITNILMDARDMYPDGWHVLHTTLAPGPTSYAEPKAAKHFTRTERPPKYYFIDFGISRQYDPSDASPIEDIIRGGDKSPPEYADPSGRCNPFPTDVYSLGNTIRRLFLDGWPEVGIPGYHGLEFIRSLVDDMVQTDPNMRPRMHEVLRRFDKTSRSLSSWKLRSRLAPRKESVFTATSRSWRHWKRAVGFIVHDVPPVPSKISGVVDSI